MLGAAAEASRTDAQLAAEDVNGALVAAFSVAAWSRIRVAGLKIMPLL